MYAIRIVGPSGYVQYWNAEGADYLSNRPCVTFETFHEANIEAHSVPDNVRYGRNVDVVNLEGE